MNKTTSKSKTIHTSLTADECARQITEQSMSNLRTCIFTRHVPYSQLATDINVHRNTFSSQINSTRMSLRTYVLIALKVGADPLELLTDAFIRIKKDLRDEQMRAQGTSAHQQSRKHASPSTATIQLRQTSVTITDSMALTVDIKKGMQHELRNSRGSGRASQTRPGQTHRRLSAVG